MHEVEISGFLGDSVLSCYTFYCLTRCIFIFFIFLKQTHGRCFADNRHIIFFLKLPGNRAGDVLLEWMLEKTCDVWKGCESNPTNSG